MATYENLPDEKLSRIGLRGVVVHSGVSDLGAYAYYPDNKEESWRQREVEIEAAASTRGFTPALVTQLAENQVTLALLQTPSVAGKTYFLNLDAFRDLGSEPSADPQSAASLPPATANAILIRETSRYYLIAESELRDLNPKDAGEAKIVVRRGAVTAAIPNNSLPLGTNCVLINKTQLLGPK
jgi:hypothetical protein